MSNTVSSQIPGVSIPRKRKPLIPACVLGMIIFVLTEIMFFSGLISAFNIIKAGNLIWPPMGQPRLPVGITAINTGFLVLSGIVLFFSNRAYSAGSFSRARKLLGLSVLLGAVFIGVQGYEWVRLLSYGITMTSSTYGSFFYVIIGTHAIHAIGAMIFMFRAYFKMSDPEAARDAFWTIQVFWYFVVAIWPILYSLVYLS